jgi:D-3-phosphoglycerate dehydrogenase
MLKAVISDHTFPTLDLQKKVIESAGFELTAIQPVCTTEDDVIERCGDADVLLVQWAPITRRVLKSLPRLKGVVRYGIGVNNIALDAAKELGIMVANVPTYCIEEVSNHAMAMILGLARRIPQDHYGIAHGGWGVDSFPPIPSFLDMTLGLVGFGTIARLVAQKARSFGFHIAAADPYVNESTFTEHGVEQIDLDKLLASADIISLHCPLVPGTSHLISDKTIQKMKPGVLIINTSRGGIIKESDLIKALIDGRVLGAGLDVFEQEPLSADSLLRSLANVLLTSHAASGSLRAAKSLQIKAAESARDILQGKRPEGALV